jgi:multidrug efflux pump
MYFVIAGVPTVSDMLSFIALKDWSERDRSVSEVIGSIFPAMSGITGLAAFPIPPGGLGQDFLDMPVGLVIQTTGSWEELGMVVNQVMAKAAQNPVLQNVQSTLYLDTPELHLDINRDKVAAVGSSIGDVGRAMQVMMGGLELTRFKLNNEQYDVILQLGKEQRRQPTDLTGLYVRGSGDQMVQLANLVDVKEAIGPRSLDHFDKLRSATIKAGLAPGASQAAALAYLEQAVHDTGVAGLHTDYTGSSRELKETGSTIGLVFGLALIFIFLVLAAQFESFVDPFVILVSVPLAVFGALFALTFAGKSMNIYSQIGLITLVGLIAKNGILIVEFANQQMEQHGLSRTDAVIEAAMLRLRPILMTTAATVLGAMPLALAHGASAEARSTIGWVIVGGMTLGTLFTLFVVPVVYTLVGKKSVTKPQIG